LKTDFVGFQVIEATGGKKPGLIDLSGLLLSCPLHPVHPFSFNLPLFAKQKL
jgi:hypothetical protein